MFTPMNNKVFKVTLIIRNIAKIAINKEIVMKEFKPAVLFIIAGAAITISAGIQMFKLMDSIKQPVKTVSQQTRVTERIEPKVTKEQGVNDFPEVEGNLAFNNVIDYDNLTKDDIYNLRKKYVSSSLFASSDYEPSDKVFVRLPPKSLGTVWITAAVLL